MVWEPSDFSCTTCALCDVNLIQELCWYFLISLLNWNFLIKYFFLQSSYPTSLHWLSTSIWNYSTSHLRNCLALSFPGETSFTVPPICHGMTEGKYLRKEEEIKNKINLTGCRFRSMKNRRGRGRCARAPRRVGSGCYRAAEPEREATGKRASRGRHPLLRWRRRRRRTARDKNRAGIMPQCKCCHVRELVPRGDMRDSNFVPRLLSHKWNRCRSQYAWCDDDG